MPNFLMNNKSYIRVVTCDFTHIQNFSPEIIIVAFYFYAKFVCTRHTVHNAPLLNHHTNNNKYIFTTTRESLWENKNLKQKL